MLSSSNHVFSHPSEEPGLAPATAYKGHISRECAREPEKSQWLGNEMVFFFFFLLSWVLGGLFVGVFFLPFDKNSKYRDLGTLSKYTTVVVA